MTDRAIHRKQGHGYDEKYSDWRRTRYPQLAESTSHYCSDVDWIEWRKGRPVAVLECRRALLGRTLEDAIASVRRLNNGFQLELLATLARHLGVPGYIVAINDQDAGSETYEGATFRVVQVVLPSPWPTQFGSLVPELSRRLRTVGDLDEVGYAEFLAKL